MKFFRMRPETCASTWCSFSSLTLNMALGKVSSTTAITSIASSFDKLDFRFRRDSLHYRLVVVLWFSVVPAFPDRLAYPAHLETCQ